MTVTWNAQGFFIARAAGYAAKRGYVQRLLTHAGFCILTETHMTEGTRRGFAELPRTSSWWSPGTAARAGVGFIINDKFVHKFTEMPTEWIEVIPGRLAVLRLRGPLGGLDLLACYMPMGVSCAMRHALEAGR